MKYHVAFDLDFKHNPYPGKFIVIEGIDGAGKTTHLKLLTNHLSKNRKVFITKNPTSGEIGQFIRRALKGDFPIDPIAIQYLFAADRATQEEEIIAHLKKDEIVLCDRYFWSALAYGLADKKTINFKQEEQILLVSFGILSMYHQTIVPDLTIYIDISPQTAIARLEKIHQKKEIYENLETLKKVKRGYDWLINQFKDKFVVVSGEKTVQEVESDIEKHVKIVLP